MDRRWLQEWKRQISLLDYLQSHNWEACRKTSGGQVGGLCPLHSEHEPSFWVHPGKNLFYCHGCGQGGDVIRLVELWHQLRFTEALAHLRAWIGGADLIEETARFYRAQLSVYPEATEYLERRGIHDCGIVEELKIGFAPGACLRAYLQQLGFTADEMQRAGVINASGRDSWFRRMVFPCGENLYGRSLDSDGGHRFLNRAKGGLYHWDELASATDIILVEGMFDLAALWQAGFRHTTCGWGTHLNRGQYAQLAGSECTVWIAFDGDLAGQQAARDLSQRLRAHGRCARRVTIPFGHDPASYFAAGATAADFHDLLAEARP